MTMKNTIMRLHVFDFDNTLFKTFEPEEGKIMWEKYYEKPYPYQGWWGRPESLDLNVFDIKPYPSVLNQLKKDTVLPNTFVMIMTSRMEKLRSEVEAVLNKNKINVDLVEMKRAEGNKGIKLLRFIDKFPDLKVINVYDDRQSDIEAYEDVRNKIPKGIEFNVYIANRGKLVLTESSRKYNILEIVIDELKNLKL